MSKLSTEHWWRGGEGHDNRTLHGQRRVSEKELISSMSLVPLRATLYFSLYPSLTSFTSFISLLFFCKLGNEGFGTVDCQRKNGKSKSFLSTTLLSQQIFFNLISANYQIIILCCLFSL